MQKQAQLDRKKQEIVNKALKKNLKGAEKASLLSSINQCTEWGDDAEKYIRTTSACPSLYWQYAVALNRIGIKLKRFRESTRYQFMLLLSLQQTWNKGLGDIITRTVFVDCKRLNGVIIRGADPYEIAIQMLKERRDYVSIAAMLKSSCNNDIIWCSFYANGDAILICTYVKPKQVYQFFRLYGYTPRKIDCYNSRKLQRVILEDPSVLPDLLNDNDQIFEDHFANSEEWMNEFYK